MRIINSEEFAKMPEGTVYCNVPKHHAAMSNLCIKGETQEMSYIYLSMLDAIKGEEGEDDFITPFVAMENGESRGLDMSLYGRDFFDSLSTNYLIYEKEDVKTTINELKKTL